MSVVSDTSWKAADGPIFEDSVYNGESYDARRETPGWDRPGFDDKDWPAAEAVKGPAGVLSAQLMPAIQVVDTIVPLKMTSPLPGVYVFDMGQNFSGWARLRVEGPRGTDVRLRFAELLYENGTLNQETLRSAQAEDHYILKGEGEEIWEPRFTYHGFRYVEVTGFPGTPKLDTRPRPGRPLRGRAHRQLRRLQGRPQRPPAHHHLGPEDEPPQHPDRLRPARRAHGLDGRRPGHGRGSHHELRHGRLLHQFHARHPRRPGREGPDHGHGASHLGLAAGRPGLGHGLSPHLLVHVSVLRRHARPRGALRRAQEIRRVPEVDGRERHPQVQPLRRLGGRREVPRVDRLVVLLLL